jgi:hypothetical protein
MPANPLADLGATRRAQVLEFLRGDGLRFWADMAKYRQPWVMPAPWRALSAAEQARRLVQAEDHRVTHGTTFALDTHLCEAVRTLAERRDVPIPFTAHTPPAASGILVPAAPLTLLNGTPLVAATWGPPMEGFTPGVHLTWWGADPNAPVNPDGHTVEVALFPDYDLHLPFLPIWDNRLTQPELPEGLEYSAVPLRAVVAAWHALAPSITDVTEQRPDALLTRRLTTLKAKRRSVLTATSTDSSAELTHKVLGYAAQGSAEAREKYPETFGALPGGNPELLPDYGVFDPGQDMSLDREGRDIARLYRTAVDTLHRLELEADQHYRGIFAGLEELRTREFGQWPTWCWMPTPVLASWLIEVYQATPEQAMRDASRIAALGAWRGSGRHIVSYQPEPPAPLAEDPVPAQLAEQLPVRGLCLLIPQEQGLRTVLAFVDTRDEIPGGELTLIDTRDGQPTPIHSTTKHTLFLREGSMLDAVHATHDHYDQADIAEGRDPGSPAEEEYRQYTEVLGWLLRPLIRASSPDARLGDAAELVDRPGLTWPPAPEARPAPTLWLPYGSSSGDQSTL